MTPIITPARKYNRKRHTKLKHTLNRIGYWVGITGLALATIAFVAVTIWIITTH